MDGHSKRCCGMFVPLNDDDDDDDGENQKTSAAKTYIIVGFLAHLVIPVLRLTITSVHQSLTKSSHHSNNGNF